MADLTPISEIIRIAGYDSVADMDIDDEFEIPGGSALMPLVIKKAAEDQIMVAHYFTQGGDRMYDPAVWFAPIKDGKKTSLNTWTPIEYRQDPALHQRDSAGISLDGFLPTWMRNLKSQGYIKRAQKQYHGGDGSSDT